MEKGRNGREEASHTETDEVNSSGKCAEQTEVDSAVYEKQIKASSAVCEEQTEANIAVYKK